MPLSKEHLELLERTIRTERLSRNDQASALLRAEQARAASRGTLGAGFYASAQEKTCATELENRATAWLTLAEQLIDGLYLNVTPDLTKQLSTFLAQELVKDNNDLVGLLRPLIVTHGHAFLMGTLDISRTRSNDRIANRLDMRQATDRAKPPTLEALADPKLSGVSDHLRRAEELAAGKRPDLANSAKEAISAVEALAKLKAGRTDGTLSDAVKDLRNSGRLEPALARLLEVLYGFTSDMPRVRHGSNDTDTLTPAEARFVLSTSRAALELLLSIPDAG